MAGQWVLRGYGPLVFTLRDGTPIGSGGPWFPRTWPEPEFGWTLWSGEHEGHGYVTEAMTSLRDWTFAHTELKTLVSYIDPDNHASQRVAQRLGGRHDPDAVAPDDDPIVIYRYDAPVTA
jgi:RimJ/RimL family protein N-acetyltransferase